MTGDLKASSIGQSIRLSIENAGGFTHSYLRDVREPPEILNGPYNSLVMCHGVMHLDWFEDAPIEKLKEVVDVNLTGTINVAQAFVKGMLDKPWRKRIIIIGSMAYKAVLNGSAVYCASKASLAQLTKCLAWELAPKGFDVYAIHPSNTENTPMSEETIMGLMRYRNLSQKEATDYWNDSCIREKSLQCSDISQLVLHLLSDKESGYLSGTQFDLAGGQRG
jgi:NAD(P)-dependent dehydrogenase (short-subunit alcohol dehydrogenase family)